MTKFSDEFIRQVKVFYQDGQKLKKFKHDKTFSITDVVNKFNLTIAQAKRLVSKK